MKVETIVVGSFEVNCFLLWDEGDQALVVDPGADADLVAAFLKQNHKQVAAYLVTHGHADHVSAVSALGRQFPAPLVIHPADAAWAFAPHNQIPPFYPAPEPFPGRMVHARDGEQRTDGGLSYLVFETPGHSPGSISFYFPEHEALFSGDVLFMGSVGRTDIPGGDSGLLANSLKRLAALPEQTRVYAGHGPQTTIGHEKKTNFFLRG